MWIKIWLFHCHDNLQLLYCEAKAVLLQAVLIHFRHCKLSLSLKKCDRYSNFCGTILGSVYGLHMQFILFVGSESSKATQIFKVSEGWQRIGRKLVEEKDMCYSWAESILHVPPPELKDKLLLILRQLVAVCGVTVQEAANKYWLRDNIVKLHKYLRSHRHLNSLTVHFQERKIWGLFSMSFWKMINFLLGERL